MKIKVILTGTSPLLMHNPRMVDPEFDLNRQIKALTDKRKKTDEDMQAIARLEWYGGLYEEDGAIVQPTSKVRKCLIETARTRKLGKAMEKAISFNAVSVPLDYEGPKSIKELFEKKEFHSRLSVGVNGKRVMRVRPEFKIWGMVLPGLFIPDVGVRFEELVELAETAGLTVGIGDNRVNGYGRFAGTVEKVK